MWLSDYLVIDVFADRPFTGNPAGVLVDATHLTDEQMRAIAREINLTETVFALPSTQTTAAVKFRILTPTGEGSFSGHAILAGVTALLRMGRFAALLEFAEAMLPVEIGQEVVNVRAGRIRPDEDEFLVWVEQPHPRLKKFPHDPTKTAKLLGTDPAEIDGSMPAMQTEQNDVILFASSYRGVMTACPDFQQLGEFSRRRRLRAWCVATTETLSPSVNAHARCFAPVLGIPEDAVTTITASSLAVYLVAAGEIAMSGKRAAVTITQNDSTGRAGMIRALVDQSDGSGYDVWVGGQCFVSMTGQVHLPI